MNAYQQWWENEGSAMRPLDHEDYEEFARRMTAIAWSNGEYVEREACAKVCEELHWPWHMGDNSGPKECATAIRARGE
jgi:hypothetical protein